MALQMLTFSADSPCSLTNSCTSQSPLIPIVVCGFLWSSSFMSPTTFWAFTELHISFLSCGSIAGGFFRGGKGRNLSFWDCTGTCELLELTTLFSYLKHFILVSLTPEVHRGMYIPAWHVFILAWSKCSDWSLKWDSCNSSLPSHIQYMQADEKVWYHLKDTLSIVSLIGFYLKCDQKLWMRSAVLKQVHLSGTSKKTQQKPNKTTKPTTFPWSPKNKRKEGLKHNKTVAKQCTQQEKCKEVG